MEYSYKFRMYPNSQQIGLIQRTFGCCRFVYNYYLSERKTRYAANGETMNYVACATDMTKLKKALPWLSEVDATALQSSLRDLDTAYKNFFRHIKQGCKPGYPHYKSKRDNHKSYKSKCVGTNIRIIDRKHIQLPKLGSVRCAISKDICGRILSATVSQNPSGKYYIALCCTDVDICKLPDTGAAAGVDLGIKDLAITSDGDKYANNKHIYKSEARLKRLQRTLSRKSKGSSN